MTLAIGQSGFAPSPHRWRVEDFFRASEAGVFESQKVELIDGELIDMPPAKDPHAWTVSRLVREVMRIFSDPPYWVKIQTTQRQIHCPC